MLDENEEMKGSSRTVIIDWTAPFDVSLKVAVQLASSCLQYIELLRLPESGHLSNQLLPHSLLKITALLRVAIEADFHFSRVVARSGIELIS
jgi:hypothetical protein